MPYRIQLQNFEGPLDLLLFLIRKNEVEIYDIPIADITQQYLEYLQFIELLDLDNASEFILMAATLIRIKARMLLPKPELEEDEEGDDPREELVQRLLEYQRYKEVAWTIGDKEKVQREFFPMSNFAFKFDGNGEVETPEKEVSLFELMAVFIELMKRTPQASEHTVERIPVSIEDQSTFILSRLENREQILFTELFAQIKERIILIVTFVALLELVKNKQLALNQNTPFSEIWIQRK